MSTMRADAVPTRQVLRDGVQERVLDLLLDGTLPAGSRVGIDTLARQLDVSPTPVREALANLEHTGLIQRTALRGYRVAPALTVHQLNDLIDARKAVELAAMAKAMDRAAELAGRLGVVHAEDLRVIAELGLDTDRPTAEYASYRAYFDADWAFHATVLEQSRNSYLVRMGEGLGFGAHRLRQTFGAGILDARQAAAEHAAVLAAVETLDPDTAVAAMAAHLEGVRTRSSQG